MDRRHLLLTGTTAALVSATPRGITGRAIDSDASAADTLVRLRAEMTRLASTWGAATPADALTVLYDLEHRAHVLSRGVRQTKAASDWAHTRAQILLMEAQALADAGRPGDAMKSAAGAVNWGARAGDTASITHGRVIASTVARAAGSTADPGKLLMAACTATDGGYAVAIARAARADAMARSGAGPDAVWGAVRTTEAADLGTGRSGFALDGWDRATRAAHLGATLAKAGLAGPATERLDEATQAFGPGSDGELVAPGALAMVQLYRSRLSLETGSPYDAEHFAGNALDLVEKGPSANVAYGALILARDARAKDPASYGSWQDTRTRAREALRRQRLPMPVSDS